MMVIMSCQELGELKTEQNALFRICLPTICSLTCLLCQFEMKLCKSHETICYLGVDSTWGVHVIRLGNRVSKSPNFCCWWKYKNHLLCADGNWRLNHTITWVLRKVNIEILLKCCVNGGGPGKFVPSALFQKHWNQNNKTSLVSASVLHFTRHSSVTSWLSAW